MTDFETAGGSGTEVRAARGSLQDGLAAIRNLEHLLGSARIGPRSLEQIVGDLRSSCAPIGHAFSSLLGEIANRGPGSCVVGQLSDCAHDHVVRLDAALVRASDAGLGARSRLALELEVHRIALDLTALRGLVDLLDAVTISRQTELDLHELVSASLRTIALADGVQSNAVRVSFQLQSFSRAVIADPRVIMPLVGLTIGMLAADGLNAVDLEVFETPEGGATLLARGGRSSRAEVICQPPHIVGLSLDVARLVAALLGGKFAHDEEARECTFVLPGPDRSPL